MNTGSAPASDGHGVPEDTETASQRLADLRREMQPLDLAIGSLRHELATRRSSREQRHGVRGVLGQVSQPARLRIGRIAGRALAPSRQRQPHFSELAARTRSDDLNESPGSPSARRSGDPERDLRLAELAVEQKRATVTLLRGEVQGTPPDQAAGGSSRQPTPDQLVRQGAVIPDEATVARLVGRVRSVEPNGARRAPGQQQRRPTVTVATRFHDLADLVSLERCLVSLQAQQDVELTVLVVLQGATGSDLEAVGKAIDRVWLAEPEPRLVSVPNPEHADIRSSLLNRALDVHYQDTSNDFFYVLDHDDLVFSHALSALARPIMGSEAALSFGKVLVARYVDLESYEFLYGMEDHFKATERDISELVIDNFFPIHGYIYHTRAMPPGRLRFNEQMDRLEDYEALLRVVTAYPVYTGARSTLVGLYCWKGQRAIDGPVEGASAEEAARWDRNRQQLAQTFVEITTPTVQGR